MNSFKFVIRLSLCFALTLAIPGLFNSYAHAGVEKARPPAVGDTAKDFTLSNLSGKQIKLSDQLKKGPVVLLVLRGYPGYQCPLCTRQMGQFISNAAKLKSENATVLMVYPGTAKDLSKRAGEFTRNIKLPDNFQFLLDPDYKFTNAYGLRWDAKNETAYPSTFVISSDEKVKFAKVSKSHGNRSKAKDVLKALAN